MSVLTSGFWPSYPITEAKLPQVGAHCWRPAACCRPLAAPLLATPLLGAPFLGAPLLGCMHLCLGVQLSLLFACAAPDVRT